MNFIETDQKSLLTTAWQEVIKVGVPVRVQKLCIFISINTQLCVCASDVLYRAICTQEFRYLVEMRNTIY